MDTQIELGDKARDAVTGYVGIVVAITTWLHGCDRITLQAQGVYAEGKIAEGHSFDVFQLELVEKGAVLSAEARAAKLTEATTARSRGGPRPEPQRTKDPRR